MRVDPEGIYLELLPGATTWNAATNDFATRQAVVLNWKPDPRPGTKWARRTFVGDELGDVLQKLGRYITKRGLDVLIPGPGAGE